MKIEVKKQFLLLIGVRCARPGESENTISPKTPTPHDQPMEEEKIKQETKKKEQIMPTGKHWLCS